MKKKIKILVGILLKKISAPLGILLILLAALLAGILIWQCWLMSFDTSVGENIYKCNIDSDCIAVQDGCCDCGGGGKSATINKNYLDYWNQKISKECKNKGACLAVESNHWTCFAEPKCINNRCQLLEKPEVEKKEVTITADKTEYGIHWETINIKVKNGLDKSIWYSPGCNSGFGSLYRLKDNDWQEIDFSFPTFHQDAEYTGYWICRFMACEQVPPIELKPNSEINQQIKSICEWPIHSIGVPETEPKIIEGGTYRLSFSYGLNRESVDLAEPIYSNEFTIKENPGVTLTTDKTDYSQGENVKITLKNNGDKEKKTNVWWAIGRFSQGRWEGVNREPCGCGVCSARPPLVLQPGQNIEFIWDQTEDSCDGANLISTQVPIGKYIAEISISDIICPRCTPSSEQIYSNEFTIE